MNSHNPFGTHAPSRQSVALLAIVAAMLLALLAGLFLALGALVGHLVFTAGAREGLAPSALLLVAVVLLAAVLVLLLVLLFCCCRGGGKELPRGLLGLLALLPQLGTALRSTAGAMRGVATALGHLQSNLQAGADKLRQASNDASAFSITVPRTEPNPPFVVTGIGHENPLAPIVEELSAAADGMSAHATEIQDVRNVLGTTADDLDAAANALGGP